jgi:hypothetical protein
VARLLVVQPLLLQAGADARLQQDGIERLAQVILGAELDAAHHAVHVIERGDHEHGHRSQRGITLELLQHGVPVEVGHHHVEQHEVHGRPRQRVERRAPAGRRLHVVALAPQAASEHVTVVVVVVDDQDHGPRRGRRSAGMRRGLRSGRRSLGAAGVQQRGEAVGGGPDAIHIGQQRRVARVGRLPPQRLPGRAHALERRA